MSLIRCAMLCLAFAASPASATSIAELLRPHIGKPVMLISGQNQETYVLSRVGAEAFCVEFDVRDGDETWTTTWCYPMRVVQKVVLRSDRPEMCNIFLLTGI